MSVDEPPFLAKAREALKAAQILVQQDCFGSAANRAYYAAFHATRAALIAANQSGPEDKWSHEAIQARLGILTRSNKTYPSHLSSDLPRSRGIREMADYDTDMVNSKTAHRAVRTAEVFIMDVQKAILP